MKNPFHPGDTKTYTHTVQAADSAAFPSGEVHPVYATFALGRDAEWACRLFVLEMKEAGEEGIGTHLKVQHHSPALIGEEVTFTATVQEIRGNSILCTYEARVGDRLVASGDTGQKILKREKLDGLFAGLRSGREKDSKQD